MLLSIPQPSHSHPVCPNQELPFYRNWLCPQFSVFTTSFFQRSLTSLLDWRHRLLRSACLSSVKTHSQTSSLRSSEIVFGKKWGPDDAIRIRGPSIGIHGHMIRRLWAWFCLVTWSLWDWFCFVTWSFPKSSLALSLWALPSSSSSCLTEIVCFPWPCGKIYKMQLFVRNLLCSGVLCLPLILPVRSCYLSVEWSGRISWECPCGGWVHEGKEGPWHLLPFHKEPVALGLQGSCDLIVTCWRHTSCWPQKRFLSQMEGELRSGWTRPGKWSGSLPTERPCSQDARPKGTP